MKSISTARIHKVSVADSSSLCVSGMLLDVDTFFAKFCQTFALFIIMTSDFVATKCGFTQRNRQKQEYNEFQKVHNKNCWWDSISRSIQWLKNLSFYVYINAVRYSSLAPNAKNSIAQEFSLGWKSVLKVKLAKFSRAVFQDHLRKQLGNLLRHKIFILSILE